MSSREIVLKTPQGERKIGEEHPCLIVAEMSGNHNHDFETACEIVRAAAAAGADAIKLQTYTADTMTIPCNNQYFRVPTGTNNAWDSQTLYALYQRAYTPWEWHEPLQRLAHELGLIFFSTP